MKPKKDSIVIYRSFYKAAKVLSDQEELELYRGIFEFGLNHKEIEMGPIPAAMFQLIKPQLEANYKKWLNGLKGGRPNQSHNQKITGEEPKDNQDETKDEPNVNVNDNVNDNVNENVFITLELNDGSQFPFFNDDLVKYRDLYQSVDVAQEFRKMSGWLDSNPKRRKTKNGIKGFVTNWLSKEQDQGGKRKSVANFVKAGTGALKEVAR